MNASQPTQLQPGQPPKQDVQPDWVYEKSTGWLYLVAVIVLAFTPLFPINWLLGLYACIATYQDLRRWGRPTTGWTIAVFLLGAFAYIFYVHKRPTEVRQLPPMPSASAPPLPPSGSVAPPAPVQAPPPPASPPGWHPDPLGKARVRWWDGSSWTSHTSE